MVIDGMSKRPEETQKLTVEYGRWLNGKRIQSVVLVPETYPDDTLVTAVATDSDDTDVVMYFRGGTDGNDYTTFVDIVVSDGQFRRDTVQLQVRSMA